MAGLAIALAGMALSLLDFWDRPTAAGLLRFYWFRLADVALPIGLALLAGAGSSPSGRFGRSRDASCWRARCCWPDCT